MVQSTKGKIMATQLIGTQTTAVGCVETMYRLALPLVDHAPDWRNVFVQLRPNGDRRIMRGRAYETQHAGEWKPIPKGSWTACFSGLTEREIAYCEAEISAVHGNWSA
jgi:hypothetical protein